MSGRERRRRRPRLARLDRLLPLACLAAAAVLFASEFMTFFEFTPEGIDPQSQQSAADRHSYAPAMLAIFAVIALFFAVGGGSKPAAIAVAICGGIGLLIFLTLDLPDANNVGTLEEGGQFLASAKAVPQGGFWLFLVGTLSLTLSGIALATLSPAQLADLRPGRLGGEAPPVEDGHSAGAEPVPGSQAGPTVELDRARARRNQDGSPARGPRARRRARD